MIVDEAKIEEKEHMSRWLIGPWNSQSNLEFGIALIHPHQKLKLHYHEQIEEIIYTIEGKIILITGSNKKIELQKGYVVHIPPKIPHTLYNPTHNTAKLVVVKNPSLPSDKILIKNK